MKNKNSIHIMKYIMLIGITVLLMLLFGCQKETYTCTYTIYSSYTDEYNKLQDDFRNGLISESVYLSQLAILSELMQPTKYSKENLSNKEMQLEMKIHNVPDKETCGCGPQ